MLGLWAKRLGVAAVSLLGLLLAAIIIAGTLIPLPGEASTPSGQPRQTSHYVTMQDGVRIAVDVWRPENMQAGETYPVLFRATRYWRGAEFSFWARAGSTLGLLPALGPRDDTAYFNSRGFIVVIADARGTGASEGQKSFPITSQETSDYAQVLDWIDEQDWSNGAVGAFGVSYDGMTAEALAEHNHPTLRAIAPTYMVYDTQFYLATLGGIPNSEFIQNWYTLNRRLDQNDALCLTDADCRLFRLLTNGAKRVEGVRIEPLVDERVTPDVLRATHGTPFRDSPLEGETGLTWRDIASYGRAHEIEESGVAIFTFAGWQDAGSADGAIARFVTTENPQTVILAPLSHGGLHDTDPFKEQSAPPSPSRADQLKMLADFFSDHLTSATTTDDRTIRYYTMNGDWQETSRWPPVGVAEQSLSLCEPLALCTDTQSFQPGSRAYDADPMTQSSLLNLSRWDTPLGGSDVIYEDRRELPGDRLTYASPPLAEDVTITGAVVADLYLTSSHPDGALHVYLEHIASDGRVTYVTEGAVRLSHAQAPVCTECDYTSGGLDKSFDTADQRAFPVGVPTRVQIPLLATSTRFAAGDRIGLTFTAGDSPQFAPLSSTDVEFTLTSTPGAASTLRLPIEEGRIIRFRQREAQPPESLE